jgi:hypothetical protein
MKGMIDKNGFLHIERAGVMNKQSCPFTQVTSYERQSFQCGDWCPLFGEILYHRKMDIVDYGENEKMGFEPTPDGLLSLTICHGKELIFDTLTDERQHETT